MLGSADLDPDADADPASDAAAPDGDGDGLARFLPSCSRYVRVRH